MTNKIATFTLGDMYTSLSYLSDDDGVWALTTIDLRTDKTYTKLFNTENDGVRAFCAAIVCDEPDLTIMADVLYSDPDMKPFLA